MSAPSLDHPLAAVSEGLGGPVDLALMLGSGLGDLAAAIEGARALPYARIPGFPAATAPGHAGQLMTGQLHGHRVVAMQGRLHLYEGHTAADIAFPIRLMARMGARRLVVTNAAGALNPNFRPGDVMLIEDHINLTGTNPLIGPHDPAQGLRFPDLSRAYDLALRAATRAAADRAGLTLTHGIYVGITGPSLETSAERRFLRLIGGDAVGMSTVTEVIAAVQAGMSVLGLSAITNVATGGPDQAPDTIEAVLAEAARAGRQMAALLAELLPALPAAPVPGA